jgi:hypothetical protein
MFRGFAPHKTNAVRRALAGAAALVAIVTLVGATSPAAASGFHGGFRAHAGYGGFHHGVDNRLGFDRHFDRRFAFGGFAIDRGYNDDYVAYDTCLRRAWGPYGWRVVDVCYQAPRLSVIAEARGALAAQRRFDGPD